MYYVKLYRSDEYHLFQLLFTNRQLAIGMLGADCQDEHTYRTVVEFVCDTDATKSELFVCDTES